VTFEDINLDDTMLEEVKAYNSTSLSKSTNISYLYFIFSLFIILLIILYSKKKLYTLLCRFYFKLIHPKKIKI
jgi:hypothetical protein